MCHRSQAENPAFMPLVHCHNVLRCREPATQPVEGCVVLPHRVHQPEQKLIATVPVRRRLLLVRRRCMQVVTPLVAALILLWLS